ncbi:hypothetical protein BGX34_009736 [Mortierella sp. NVP85]|nr:hypothetical protein BGX34_009736 [Mortierella sp. NVP85]
MTDSDFEDNADFDVDDISSILKDIDNANQALDVMEGRANKLKANIMSLLQAQSRPNPYANYEPEVPQPDTDGSTLSGTGSASSVDKQDSPKAPSNATTSPAAPASPEPPKDNISQA